jgi:hypothetical protein
MRVAEFRRTMRRLSTSIAMIASVLLAACGGTSSENQPDAGTDGGIVANENACGTGVTPVTATQLFNDVIQSNCSSCHFAGAPDNSLVMNSATALQATVGQASTFPGGLKVTDPNHSENSTLFLKAAGGTTPGGIRGPNGQSVGNKMPNNGLSLTETQLSEIKNWICSGAQ